MKRALFSILAVLGIALFASNALADTQTLQLNAGDIRVVECPSGVRAFGERISASMYRLRCGALPTPISTSTAIPTAIPTSTLTPTVSSTSSATNTATEIPTATITPSPTPTGADACTNNPDCGTPRNFCDLWIGGWCNDYRQLGAAVFESPFPPPTEQVSFDCLDTGAPSYLPSMLGGTLPFPCAFHKFEHFMTRMESGGFGVAMLRYHRPVDLSEQRHIHLDADLKPSNNRNYFRVMLSPDLTKRDSDDRGGTPYPRSFIQLWFRNGSIEGVICRDVACDGNPDYPFGNGSAFGSSYPPFSPLLDNVRVSIDILVSRTSISVWVNGQQKINTTFAPLNFDKAYLYLSQASYNPCKDGQCSVAVQIAHWDNVAVDGPLLAPNSLTPAGVQDVVFNAYSATACNVNGVPAIPITEGPQGFTWVTWVARTPVGPVAVSCNYSYVNGNSNVIRGLEIVKQ